MHKAKMANRTEINARNNESVERGTVSHPMQTPRPHTFNFRYCTFIGTLEVACLRSTIEKIKNPLTNFSEGARRGGPAAASPARDEMLRPNTDALLTSREHPSGQHPAI